MARYTATITATGQTFEGVSEATLAVLQRTFDTVTVNKDHSAVVTVVRGRYPYRPACTCGQQFRGYTTEHAARLVADDHAS